MYTLKKKSYFILIFKKQQQQHNGTTKSDIKVYGFKNVLFYNGCTDYAANFQFSVKILPYIPS